MPSARLLGSGHTVYTPAMANYPLEFIADDEATRPSVFKAGSSCYCIVENSFWRATADNTWTLQSPGGSPAWGAITGTLADQTDLQTTLNGKSPTSHNHDAAYDAIGAASAAIATHEGAADPHPTYQRESEKGSVNGYAGLDAGGTVPDAQIPTGIARDSEITSALSTHESAADPHAVYQKESEKGAANGYASLGAGALVPVAQLASGMPDGTKFVRDDGTLATPPGGGGQAFPVGSVFIAVVATNPATLLGYGTWAAFAAGRVLVGIDAGQTEFDIVEETGGAKTHVLTTAEMPAHTHLTQRYPTATGTNSGFTIDTSMSGTLADNTLPTKTAGGGGAHNNLQPYIVVYMWKRTA